MYSPSPMMKAATGVGTVSLGLGAFYNVFLLVLVGMMLLGVFAATSKAFGRLAFEPVARKHGSHRLRLTWNGRPVRVTKRRRS